MKVIFKHKFGSEMCLQLPQFSKVVHVGVQRIEDSLPTLWVEHDKDNLNTGGPVPLDLYTIVATGQPYESGKHIGTAVCAGGQLVWHILKEVQ